MTATADGDQPSGESTVAWFNCFAGIAGDMALASLVDAGADRDELRSALASLPLTGWEIEFGSVLRGGLAATAATVSVTDTASHRTFAQLLAIIEQAGLPRRVTERSVKTITAIATVEARLHHSDLAEVHLHELGGHDAVIDIVGTAIALELLGIDEVTASPVAVGTGTISTRHGLLPNPGPAVLGLLKGAPIFGLDRDVELTTPTGAGLLAALASQFGPIPGIVVSSTGYGAGSRDLDGLPNCTQVVIGRRHLVSPGHGGHAPYSPVGQPLVVLEANLDDATGEQLADALVALLGAGAADAWITPVVMKKGRPGHVVSVLADTARAGWLREILVETTGSFGVRHSVVDRWSAARRIDVVDVDGGSVRVKVSGTRAKFEHDDVAGIATATHRSFTDVLTEAEVSYAASARDDPIEVMADDDGPGST